jgi:hypothetical protein
MSNVYTNQTIVARFDDLICEGERLFGTSEILNPVELTQWLTSSLNLLDKLSISTNRFVKELEFYGRVQKQDFNLGLALGVIKSAKEEYLIGLAIDYHLSVVATTFDGLLDQAKYLFEKRYLRAASVIGGAALEEGLKERARAETIEFSSSDGITAMVHKLKKVEIGVLNKFEADKLEGCAKLRNAAAHGGEFQYTEQDVKSYLQEIEASLQKLFTF